MTMEPAKVVLELMSRRSSMHFAIGGGHDCCSLAREAVRLRTGRDPAPELTYSDQDSALAILKQHGGLDGLLRHVLGEPVPPAELGMADIALVRLPLVGELVGVICRQGAIVPMPVGLDVAPARCVVHGWRI